MKKILALCLSAVMLMAALPLAACNTKDEGKKNETTNTLTITSDYKIIRSDRVDSDSPEKEASLLMRNLIRDAVGIELTRETDWIHPNEKDTTDTTKTKEILIGHTNRAASDEAIKDLAFNEFIIKVSGPKLVICGASEAATLQAVEYFGENYITGGTLELPNDFSIIGTADFSISDETGISFVEMGDNVLKAFNSGYYNRGNLHDTEFWDAAEILESYIDAYEQTGSEKYLTYVKAIAQQKFQANNVRVNWCASNAFNDDIAWVCIAFTRIYLLTGEKDYLNIAKNNFDIMWNRAYSPDVLGGGLWWKDDQKNTKNSCIQCPASIAACLIGKATNDDSYYEKAKEVMDWEFENLFEPSTGKVYDAYPTSGNKSTWSSTYNQGTFVGACTLLHEKYGDEKYLEYAAKAVEYGMTKLENKDGVLTGESGGDAALDLCGFKGILTRWFYRYAKYTNDLNVLFWLQKNANTAYGNRNSDNFIWTDWADPTNEDLSWDHALSDNGKYDVFGLSTAIALMFNCEQWW